MVGDDVSCENSPAPKIKQIVQSLLVASKRPRLCAHEQDIDKQHCFYAVDPWPAAMGPLERKLAYHGIENVELVRQGSEAMGLPDRCADLIVSNLGANNFSDPVAVLAECRRVMKRDGLLFVTTNLQGHMAEAYRALRDVLDDTGLQDRHEALARQEAQRGTVASVWALLSAAGFTDIAHEESSFACASPTGLPRWVTGSCDWGLSLAGGEG